MSILASAFQCDADSKIKNATTRSPGTLNLGFRSARPAAAGIGVKTYSQGDRPGTRTSRKLQCNRRSQPKLGLIKYL